MSRKLAGALLLILALVLSACAAPATPDAAAPAAGGEEAAAPAGDAVTITIESWRNDDLPIWQDVIIPAFNAQYPNIEVIFAPTAAG